MHLGIAAVLIVMTAAQCKQGIICAHSVQHTSERVDLRKSMSLKSSSLPTIAGADEEEEEEVVQHKPQQIWCPYTSIE